LIKLQKLLEPWSVAPANEENQAAEKKINLRIIDMETGQQSTCEPDVAKNWNGMTYYHAVGSRMHVSTWAKTRRIITYTIRKKGLTNWLS